MKKSTIFLTLAIIGAIATLAAANLKMKNEYAKGKIQAPYVRKELPAFRYIRQAPDPALRQSPDFEITVQKNEQPGVSVFFKTPAAFLYTVSNDTLLISANPAGKNEFYSANPIHIYTPSLEYIQLSDGAFIIADADSSHLTAKLSGRTSATFKFSHIHSFDLIASDQANAEISSARDIEEARISLAGRSWLHINDFSIHKKTLQLGDSVGLHLKGRSIADFGINH